MPVDAALSLSQYIAQAGLPEPTAVWVGYLVPELVLPFVIAGAQYTST
jgi:hypothetical protein